MSWAHQNLELLGALVKLREVTISFVMSVCLPVRPSAREQLDFHFTDIHKNMYFNIFMKSIEKIQV